MEKKEDAREDIRNYKFWETLDKDGEVSWAGGDCPKEELDAARAKGVEIMKRGDVGMRSCWICNPAHEHFLQGDWGDEWVLNCFQCGRFFYNKIDITDYEEIK